MEAIGWHSRDRLRLRLGWSDRLGWGEEDRWLGLVVQRNVPPPLDCLLSGRQRWLILKSAITSIAQSKCGGRGDIEIHRTGTERG